MKLGQALKEHAGQKVKIGSQSSFIYCGLADNAFEVLKQMNKRRLEELNEMIDAYQRKLTHFDSIWAARIESAMTTAKRECRERHFSDERREQRLAVVMRECEQKRKRDRERVQRLLETLPEQIRTFKRYEDRKIREIYPSIEEGIIILFEGNEVGAYWTFEEYEERKGDDNTIQSHRT